MIIENKTYQSLKTKHAKELLEFLISAADEFSILCNLDGVEFNPQLPDDIKDNFQDVILFVLANYTLSTAKIENNILSFEAGFGEENFGSIVSVDISRIIQILENDTPLFINLSATLEKKNPFKLNPRNKKFMSE